MANLIITAANIIVPVANTGAIVGAAGVTITAGDMVYLDTLTTTWKLAKCNGTDAEAGDDGLAVALNDAVVGQPFSYLNTGNLDFGAIVAAGSVYVVSNTAGAIMPIADLVTSTWRFSPVGYGTDTDTMALLCSTIGATGVAIL